MIVWGGAPNATPVNTGGRYDPVADRWLPTSTFNAPPATWVHTAVWTGKEMIVWGGHGVFDASGGRYNPIQNRWTATSQAYAPSPRSRHTAVWTGQEMIVWGGADPGNILGNSGYLATGGRYNPQKDSWRGTALYNAPAARSFHTAVWSGQEMIVWGGDVCGQVSLEGGRYDPRHNRWLDTAKYNAPTARRDHAAVWTGREMVIWGGNPSPVVQVPTNPSSFLDTGARYVPRLNRWFPIGQTNAPSPRYGPAAVWTGFEVIVWGGANGQEALDTGGVLER